MHKPKLLFQAPIDFDLAILKEMRRKFTMDFDGAPDVIVCNPKADFVFDETMLALYPGLQILATPSTGVNHIDHVACKRRGVKVLSLLDDRVRLDTISASAEYTFKMILDGLRKVPAFELQDKVIGLVGYGRIGRRVDIYCDAFDADVLYVHDPYKNRWDSLNDVFSKSDVVVICCSLTEETKGMIDKHYLRQMKRNAVLVNSARGEVINEQDLIDLMQERPDIRVVLDVLTGETTGTQNPYPLISKGAIITPHIAGETYDSRTKATRIILKLVEREFVNE